MNSRLLATLLLALAAAPAALHAADAKPAEKTDAIQRHPLRGVITAVVTDQSALRVKHEEIPGVMHAMTMQFKVDAATLKAAKVGDAITGLMSRQGNAWVLEDVKPAAKPAK
ncbi:MAG: copper-binding protein [Verrucomicrobia bacterium]|nr:copper-binding protein [Verrucomicrobiota bacterium]